MFNAKAFIEKMTAYLNWSHEHFGDEESQASCSWLEKHPDENLGDFLETIGYRLVNGEYVK